MPEFKKSSGYKMRGFSYPGESPMMLTNEEKTKKWDGKKWVIIKKKR